MTVLVIGLGSMGRRRIRLIKQYDNSAKIVGVDTREDRRRQVEIELGIKAYESVDLAFNDATDVFAVFISTSPLTHSVIIRECLKRGLHTFTEINLVDDGYEENVSLARDKGVVLFLSSTFMYRREIEYIKKAVFESGHGKSYIYHVGQYLPDWHPWESFKDFFVGDKRTNGCRELMAIEFPWIFDVFGTPVEWNVMQNRNSSIDIDYPDTIQILFKHSSGSTGLIQIDVVSRKAVRNFECMADDLYISWDGTPYGLNRYDPSKKEDIPIRLYDSFDKRDDYSSSIIEDAYLSEIEEFFNAIKGEAVPRHDFESDKAILSVIDDIEGIRK